ncbi:MAG TPA: DUF853 family protein [Candidatus Woesearchaeota archaeon]|nr:DUF853 family protein [Candidatus Woesearchaeota archaeon]
MAKGYLGFSNNKKLNYNLSLLTRHTAILGTTGSGKTVMSKILLEEAMLNGIPVIAIDPKGDVSGICVAREGFDFRPFIGNNKANAEKVANIYIEKAKEFELKKEEIFKLKSIESRIYTPKSSIGEQISLMPDLTAPKNFESLSKDHTVVADFVEPISESILSLAEIKGQEKLKSQSLISNIIIHYWKQQNDLNISELIKAILNPPFDTIGSLELNDVITEKNRKKLASQINLLLSSPSKKAMAQGETLDIKELFSKKKLSVFDLRFSGNLEERQFVVQIILQEIYKFLISSGGNEKLRYILYIDELAGILPPPPANPATKKLLELLIRQSRAFGLGIIIATQNPGDVDYKVFGNIGTRFIGKLRTDNDSEKVAGAIGISPSKLKTSLSTLKTGEFILNNSVDNSTKPFRARWLYTLHTGPFSPEQITWINNPKEIKAPLETIGLNTNVKDKKRSVLVNEAKPKKLTHATQIVKVALEEFDKKRKDRETKKTNSRKQATKKQGFKLFNEEKTTINQNHKEYNKQGFDPILKELIGNAKRYSDTLQLKLAISESKVFVPHLRIVIEPNKKRGLNLELEGPYVFDLTANVIPVDNYLKQISFRQYTQGDIQIKKPTASLKFAFDYAIKDAKDNLRTNYYKSTLLNIVSEELDIVVDKNKEYMLKVSLAQEIRILQTKKRKLDGLKEKISKNKKKIAQIKRSVMLNKTKRTIKKVLKRSRLSKTTQEIEFANKRIKRIEKEIKVFENQIKKVSNEYDKKALRVKEKAIMKAQSGFKEYKYRPTNKDLKVHSTILLVPKRLSSLE